MSDSKTELRQAFLDAGWEAMGLSHGLGIPVFHGLFVGGFATCAVVLAEGATAVARNWRDMQGALVQLRSDRTVDPAKDLYLIFVVEQIENETINELQPVLDDNRVCRKICIERRGRSVHETLEDISFFPTPATVASVEPKFPENDSVIKGLPQNVLVDLEQRGPEQILERLLNGEYATE